MLPAQAALFAKSLVRGEQDGGKIARTVLAGRIRELMWSGKVNR